MSLPKDGQTDFLTGQVVPCFLCSSIQRQRKYGGVLESNQIVVHLALGSFGSLVSRVTCVCVVVGAKLQASKIKQLISWLLSQLSDDWSMVDVALLHIVGSLQARQRKGHPLTTRVNQHLHRHRYLIQLDRIHDGSGPLCDEDVGPERPLRRRWHRRPQCLGESKPDGDASAATPFQEYPQDGPCIL